MKRKRFLSLAVLAAVFGVGAFAHAEAKPEYAWLVFGPEGKLRVQVTLEGEALTLEQFVDGKPTGRKNHFQKCSDCTNLTFADPDGKTSYNLTSISVTAPKPNQAKELFVNIDIKGPLQYRQYCDVELKEDADKARLAHFHGPLTAGPVTIYWKIPPKLALKRGDKPTDLPALVGTMDGDKGCWVVVRSHEDNNQPAFPKGLHPYVDVEFPAKQIGGATIKKRYPLDQFCWGAQFHGPVRVPEEAGAGKAKVTYSFEAWKEGKVRPTTIEIPIKDAEVEKKDK